MKKAFTLVEIMIVFVVMGLLAAMAIPAFQKVKDNQLKKQRSERRIHQEQSQSFQPAEEITVNGYKYRLVK